MLQTAGKNPHKSLELIDRLGLYHATFTDPNNIAMPRPRLTHWKAAYTFLDRLSKEDCQTPGSIYDVLVTNEREGPRITKQDAADKNTSASADGEADPKTVFTTWVLAAIVPWEQIPDPHPRPPGPTEGDPRSANKKKGTASRRPTPPLPTLACTEGFRANNKVKAVVTAAHQNRAAIFALRDVAREQGQPETADRERFGMAIREWDTALAPWRLQVLYAILTDAMLRAEAAAAAAATTAVKARRISSSHDDGDVGNEGSDVLNSSTQLAKAEETWEAAAERQVQMHGEVQDQVRADWQQFLDHLGPKGLDVMEAPSLKPLLHGHALSEALGAAGMGQWMTPALQLVVRWQLRHPGATDPAGAVEEVRRHATKLEIPGLSSTKAPERCESSG